MTDGKRKEYFGQSLKCIRLRRGMTQKELAEKNRNQRARAKGL